MSRRLQTMAMLVGYLALAVAATWPLAARCGSHLPTGQMPYATVPLLNLWTLWWNADRIDHAYSGYWDAPIFHPAPNAFALSEPQPLAGLAARILWPFLPPAAVYNLLVFAALVLNGWFAQRFALRLRVVPWIAIVCGATVVLLPIVHRQLGVLQLIPLWCVLWSLDAAWRLARAPSTRRSCEFGAAFTGTYLLCVHHALFLSVLLIPAGLWAWFSRRRRLAHWCRLAPGIVLCAAIAGPLAWKQQSVLSEMNLRRPSESVASLSVHPAGFTHTHTEQWFPPAWPRPEICVSPGSLKWILALAGVAYGLSCRRRRRATVYLGLILVAAIFLAMGPHLAIGKLSPYTLLVDFYPGFAQVRSAYRFAYFVQLAVCLLAAVGMHGLVAWLKPYHRRAAVTLALVAGCLAAVEARPRPPRVAPLPAIRPAWCDWIMTHTRADDVLVFLPLPRDERTASFQSVAVQMYWQQTHRRPLVNGYSGFLPPAYQRLANAVRGFPDDASTAALRRSGAEYGLVASDREVPQGWQPVYRDADQGLTIYRLP